MNLCVPSLTSGALRYFTLGRLPSHGSDLVSQAAEQQQRPHRVRYRAEPQGAAAIAWIAADQAQPSTPF